MLRKQPAIYLLVQACQQLWLVRVCEDSYGNSLTLCIRNLPSLHTALLLAVSVPPVTELNRLSKSTLSPELHTRRLPITHVQVGNYWSHSRSPPPSSKTATAECDKTTESFALIVLQPVLRPADGDTCRKAWNTIARCTWDWMSVYADRKLSHL
jgi:hypothetical protein